MALSRMNQLQKQLMCRVVSVRLTSTLGSNTSDDEFQYLQKSILSTDHFQRSLPRLPIPKLEKTCERYLQSLRPLISNDAQYNRSQEIVRKFEKGAGLDLHTKLLQHDKANKHTSYICKPWFDMYLASRVPVVLNYNPFMSWKDDPKPEFNKPSYRVTNMLISALRFYRSLQENTLDPEVFHLNPKKSDNDAWRKMMGYTPKSIAWYVSAIMYKAFALDMSQFGNLFASTRIPQTGLDEIRKFDQSRHVVFLKGGEFFSLDVLDESFNIKSPEHLYTCVKSLCERRSSAESNSITAFSADDRDRWAAIRKKLISLDAKNREHLERIDSALFVICLDDVEHDQNIREHAHNFLHGNNNREKYDKQKPLNRWFDKCFSILFSKDGHAAVNFEHSWGDGVAVLRFFNEVFYDSTKNHFVGPSTSIDGKCNAYEQLQHLDFVFDNEIKAAAEQSHQNWHQLTSRLELSHLICDDLTREQFKQFKVSPDAMFQLAFQMAYYRLFNGTTATYESCSTSAFKHGRTETMRPCTMETLKACEEIVGKRNNLGKAEFRQLLNKCSERHAELAKNASMGQGFDRHLFALKHMHLQNYGNAQPLPDLYTDSSFVQANHFILSTSTLYGTAFSGGGFGPVVQDGYGLAYGYVDGQLGVLCSTYKQQRNGQQLVDAIEQSLKEIKNIFS